MIEYKGVIPNWASEIITELRLMNEKLEKIYVNVRFLSTKQMSVSLTPQFKPEPKDESKKIIVDDLEGKI